MTRTLLLCLFIGFTLFPQAASARKFKDFESWKQHFIRSWGKREVPRAFIAKTLEDVEPNRDVIKTDKNQVTESVSIHYPTWIKKWLDDDPSRIERGQELLKEHSELLGQVEKKYGVDKEAIVALWGVETLYGKRTGSYSVLESLATLAFEGRRRKFFETQLFTALKILQQGHVSKEDFKGSWSGAMGQCQFMPSSFTQLAIDFDGDGKKDIWNSLPDLFASIANYLKKAKWKKGAAVGTLAFPSKKVAFNLERYRTAAQYNQLGLKNQDGKPLQGDWKRRAVEIPFQDSPIVLRGSNYMPILRWNQSSLFAALTIILMEGFHPSSP